MLGLSLNSTLKNKKKIISGYAVNLLPDFETLLAIEGCGGGYSKILFQIDLFSDTKAI